jgi:hypothetical protein
LSVIGLGIPCCNGHASVYAGLARVSPISIAETSGPARGFPAGDAAAGRLCAGKQRVFSDGPRHQICLSNRCWPGMASKVEGTRYVIDESRRIQG